MIINKSNQLKIGVALSYIQMGASIIIGLLYTPIMIRLLGQSEYGLYNTVASMISMISMLSLGFNSSYIRYYSKYKKNEDFDSIFKLNGLFLIIFIIIGLVAFACSIYLMQHLKLVFSTGLTSEELETAKILTLLLGLNLMITLISSVFISIITANERFVLLKTIGIISTICSPLITLPLLFSGFGSIAVVSITLLITICVDSVYIYYVLYKLKYRFYFKGFEKGIVKDLFIYTSFIAINILIDQINWNIDKVLLGRFQGTAAVAIYSVGYSLYHYYMLFSTSISGVFIPRVHKIVNETINNKKLQTVRLTDLMVKVGRIQYAVLGLLATGIFFWGDYFITKIWAGEAYADAYVIAVIFVFASSIDLIQNTGIEIQRALNKHSFRSIVYLIVAIINFVVSYKLCQEYGALGCAIGTVASLILGNGIIMNCFYHLKCNINMFVFWKNILNMSRGLIIPIIFGIFISKMTSSIMLFFIHVLIYSCIYFGSMWFFSFNNYEKQLVKRIYSKIVLVCKRGF